MAAARKVTSQRADRELAIGNRLRAERERRNRGVRELSRELNLSASMISQIELGRVTPSMHTLYAITSALGISLDKLFNPDEPEASGHPGENGHETLIDGVPKSAWVAGGGRPVRHRERRSLSLVGGVRWELLTTEPERDIELILATYEVGGETAPAGRLMRHGGSEFHLVLTGRLGITVGFETHTLEALDSFSFPSSVPHRLFNKWHRPSTAICCVVDRNGDDFGGFAPPLTGDADADTA
jgi:transcriptional regulator with XRE-family HTH domain